MYKANLISADFEESTMEFEIKGDFTVKTGEYVILLKEDYEKQCNIPDVVNQRELLTAFREWWWGNREDVSNITNDDLDRYLGG